MTDRYVPVSFQEKEGGGGATLHTMLESKKWSLLVYRPAMDGGTHYRLLCTRPVASKLLAMPGELWETQKKYTWKGYDPTLNEINWVQGDEARMARLVDEDLGGGRKRKNTAQAEDDEDMEPDFDVERPWDRVDVYTPPLDIDADELEGLVRPDDAGSAMTKGRSIPGVAPSVRQAKLLVLQDQMGASPSGEQMDTTDGVMRAALVEAIPDRELLRIEGQGSDTVEMITRRPLPPLSWPCGRW